MRTLRLALAAVAAFAFDASAAPVTVGMGNGTTILPPNGMYQQPLSGSSAPDNQGFHAGGVAACDGCHVMHNASSGVAKSTTGASGGVAAWTNTTNAYLLQGGDQSSTCLICHSGAKTAGYQFIVADVTTAAAPTNFTPGGDFGWLKLNFTNSPSQRHGHNVAAVDFGLAVDPDLKAAPGGTYAGAAAGKAAFACSNCHDPHGRYRVQDNAGTLEVAGPSSPGSKILPIKMSGSYGDAPVAADFAVGAYRILAGKGYAPASNPAFAFPNDPPIAVAPTAYNKAEGSANGGDVRVAYGTGMSEWCQNCHTNIHLDTYVTGRPGLRHPAGSTAFLHAGQYDVYNKYISSGDMTGTNAYTSLVPFEQGKSIPDLKTSITGTIIADSTSNVMCLSCHRAHASAFDSMVRWDQNATFLTDGSAILSGVTNRTPAQNTAGYYGRTAADLGKYQRSLCNKCHGKD